MSMTAWLTSALGGMAGAETATVAASAAKKASTVSAADNVAAAATGSEWWTKGLSNALPQILNVSSKRAGMGNKAPAASAKPVTGNASSAMQVPQMIGKAASSSPLDNLNQWSNLF